IMSHSPFPHSEGQGGVDLHRPYVDEIILVSDSGQPMYRETDLIDVWFDSGAMPYAQFHYPFENGEKFPSLNTPHSPLEGGQRGEFAADFSAEGVDQTRGRVVTLNDIDTMLFDGEALKNVISHGLVLDKNGNKMSKSK